MNEQLSEKDIEVWQKLVESHIKFALASNEFLLGDIDRVSLMRQALSGQDRATAFYFLRYLKQEELIQLFDILISLASFGHGSIDTIREAILSLPRDWVIKNVEQFAEPLLAEGTYDEYRRFLELYYKLDKDLTLKLAQRAIQHSDYDIKEAGEDYLEMLEQENSS